jgi:hypothetical protein
MKVDWITEHPPVKKWMPIGWIETAQIIFIGVILFKL